jgi:hypothetical protein
VAAERDPMRKVLGILRLSHEGGCTTLNRNHASSPRTRRVAPCRLRHHVSVTVRVIAAEYLLGVWRTD